MLILFTKNLKYSYHKATKDMIYGYIQRGPKVVAQTFGLIAQRFVAHENSHLVNTMLLVNHSRIDYSKIEYMFIFNL